VELNQLGASGPMVTTVGVGTSPLGGMPQLYGHDVDEASAVATVRRVLQSPVNFIDTSNEYSAGESERRIGVALREAPLPEGFVIATKADPLPGEHSFTGQRVLESYRESAERLGVDHFKVYYLHDPERFDFARMTAPGGAVEAMVQLKAEGLVGAIGVAGGDIGEMKRYVDTGAFDILLNHSQYNLLDRAADRLIDHTVDAGVAFVNAAPYASGMLAKPASASPRFQYRSPSAAITERTKWLRAECARFGVPLAALALQFSTRDPRIRSTVVGVSSPARVDALVANEALEIPGELWDAVWEGLGIGR
jgi:D-threo-aldose 1-dehydrogenase